MWIVIASTERSNHSHRNPQNNGLIPADDCFVASTPHPTTSNPKSATAWTSSTTRQVIPLSPSTYSQMMKPASSIVRSRSFLWLGYGIRSERSLRPSSRGGIARQRALHGLAGLPPLMKTRAARFSKALCLKLTIPPPCSTASFQRSPADSFRYRTDRPLSTTTLKAGLSFPLPLPFMTTTAPPNTRSSVPAPSNRKGQGWNAQSWRHARHRRTYTYVGFAGLPLVPTTAELITTKNSRQVYLFLSNPTPSMMTNALPSVCSSSSNPGAQKETEMELRE
ncbi:hypothetical protein M409DRAFT_53934 [Zasmidium cellare ATCC 36951]|uniref:Uncharacterized protein n=1 Tax=Zasmidium cellare ATCC 36951 TaxID=1080233 RepID=A0A6A6CME6_ZASCE|nr:uncharacterized protein M409DRAFT_53934 [Zasmidium cellare ATCC 36951]KAF2167330.1 hypothetical protein M409DRAFT_53934 [Zasmidium cellare ATCC 36951]